MEGDAGATPAEPHDQIPTQWDGRGKKIRQHPRTDRIGSDDRGSTESGRRSIRK